MIRFNASPAIMDVICKNSSCNLFHCILKEHLPVTIAKMDFASSALLNIHW